MLNIVINNWDWSIFWNALSSISTFAATFVALYLGLRKIRKHSINGPDFIETDFVFNYVELNAGKTKSYYIPYNKTYFEENIVKFFIEYDVIGESKFKTLEVKKKTFKFILFISVFTIMMEHNGYMIFIQYVILS